MAGQIVKKYWKWNEQYNPTPFKLGVDIMSLLEQGLVTQDPENPKYFIGKEQIPWRICTENNQIACIIYRSSAPFFDQELWDLFSIEEFEKRMNTHLTSATEEARGDILIVIFRDSFVQTAGIMRRK